MLATFSWPTKEYPRFGFAWGGCLASIFVSRGRLKKRFVCAKSSWMAVEGMGWLISLTPPRFLSRRRRESQKSCFWEGVPKKRDMSRVSALRAAILKVVDESDGEEV